MTFFPIRTIALVLWAVVAAVLLVRHCGIPPQAGVLLGFPAGYFGMRLDLAAAEKRSEGKP